MFNLLELVIEQWQSQMKTKVNEDVFAETDTKILSYKMALMDVIYEVSTNDLISTHPSM